jgi:hypothetical protein
LIAATSGRAFWILDDLSLIRQYKKDAPAFSMYQPSGAYLANGGSELNDSDEEFTGANKFRGVNPANGVVLYYQLPELKKDDDITLDITDAEGKPVRSFSSKKDSSFKKWDGGPGAEPALSKSKGLNRFVWNMRYATIPGVPNVYIEGNYEGHKAVPGKYTFTLKSGNQRVTTEGEILANPLYPGTPATYREYHAVMSNMERDITAMHKTVNSLYEKQAQLDGLLKTFPSGDKYDGVKREAEALLKKLKAWDEDMVQRKARAYDDVENYVNKFTANFLFLINQTESDLPRVNQSSLDTLETLGAQWKALQARSEELLTRDIPGLNRKLWELGIGAIWKN